MIHSLRVRLLLTLVIVVAVAVGTVALLTSRSTSAQFQRYIERDAARDTQILAGVLEVSKEGQQAQDPQTMLKKMAHGTGDRLILVDEAGHVVADSGGKLTGETVDWAMPAMRSYPAIALQKPTNILTAPMLPPPPEWQAAVPAMPAYGVASAASIPYAAPIFIQFNSRADETPGLPDMGFIVARLRGEAPNSSEGIFIGSVNRSLGLAALAAGTVAMLLTVVLSRRILAPVESLTAAARRMEKGDLSQRVTVQSNDEIATLAHAFNAMADGLERQETLRRNMVTDVAHELRTPLTNIRGYLEAVRDGVAEPVPEIIESLHEEAMLLSRLVDDLQELSLAEAGRLRLEREPADLAEIVTKALNSVQPLVVAKGLDLQVCIEAGLPPVDVDTARIGQVLRNLLNNAITHTPTSGTIAVTASNTDHEVVVSVRNTGTQIAPEHLSHIFDRFYRADASRARITGGAGLGLAIVKQLVEAHGGRIEAQSTPGHGTTLSFALPAMR